MKTGNVLEMTDWYKVNAKGLTSDISFGLRIKKKVAFEPPISVLFGPPDVLYRAFKGGCFRSRVPDIVVEFPTNLIFGDDGSGVLGKLRGLVVCRDCGLTLCVAQLISSSDDLVWYIDNVGFDGESIKSIFVVVKTFLDKLKELAVDRAVIKQA